LEVIDKQLKEFRSGARFGGEVAPFTDSGKPSREAVAALAEAMKTEGEAVREQIARLLAELGRQTDPLHEAGGNLIRNRQIISILAGQGLANQSPTRDFCLDQLQMAVPPHFLKEQGAVLARDLKERPDATTLLVVAKGKLSEAAPVVDSLYESREWREIEETKIARAALGDEVLEKEYIEAFLKTTDPEEKAERAEILGRIGTEGALGALAGEMRTDLVVEMPNVFLRSVRVDIMAALSYNFPDKPILYDNAVVDDSGYAAVEKFCEEEFGIVWKKERPEFLTIMGFPSEGPE